MSLSGMLMQPMSAKFANDSIFLYNYMAIKLFVSGGDLSRAHPAPTIAQTDQRLKVESVRG